MAHGPAIMAERTAADARRLDAGTLAPTTTTVSAWCISRLASLNGLRIGSTCSTPANRGQRLDLEFLLVADDADDGALLAAAEMRFEAQFLDVFQDMLDLLRRGVGSQER